MPTIATTAILAAVILSPASPPQNDTVLFRGGGSTITKSAGPKPAITVHRGNQKCPKGKHWVVIVFEDGSGSFSCQ